MSHNFNKNLEWSVLQMNLKEKEKKATTKKKKKHADRCKQAHIHTTSFSLFRTVWPEYTKVGAL